MNNDNITPAKVSRGVNAGQRNVLRRQPGNLRPTTPSPKPPTMKDDSISPDPQDSGGDDSVKVYANISTLAVRGVSPAVGDTVTLTVQGKVDSVEGDVVCVVPEMVNGQPAPQAPPDADEQGDDMANQHDALYANAQSLDRGGY